MHLHQTFITINLDTLYYHCNKGTTLKSIDVRKKTILSWLERIGNSKLTVSEFFKKNKVPFCRSQYFSYKKNFSLNGEVGIGDNRGNGKNRKLSPEIENFLVGYLSGKPGASQEELQRILLDKYGCSVSISTISRALPKIYPQKVSSKNTKQNEIPPKTEINQMGGFELIIALAYHLGWPQRVSEIIIKEVNAAKRRKAFSTNLHIIDKKGRNKEGNFTKNYNMRKDVRENRFASITEKRLCKNWNSMNIFRDQAETIMRKTLAILSLPVITLNGNVRSVDLALGESLKHYCGFNYKQSSLNKYLSELKYLGVSTKLLHELTQFWFKWWKDELEKTATGPLICYYIDGNTKALWSSKRVKKNKVTMIGRVMGCLEQVFIHDGLGNPIFLETHSGHGPVGEHVLGMFKKIEDTILQIPGSNTKVSRAIVMDGSSNSVKTLRAFVSQDKYHYITPLDDNQWNDERIISIGRSIRYKHGEADLREVVIEMEDSNEKGYLISTRAVKIDWDNGKTTVLLTSLPLNIADASEIVQSYFKRWPAEELQYKHQKKVVSLHRVAGYGKKEVTNEKIREKQSKAQEEIYKLTTELKEPLCEINNHEEIMAKKILKQRKIRNKSKIEDGNRIIPENLYKKFEDLEKEINVSKREIIQIEKRHEKKFKKLKRYQKEWLRIQKKDTEYVVDVELDQIVTFHRIALANLYAYFIKYFLDGQPITLTTLLHSIIHLKASISETDDTRKIILQNNKKDPVTMKLLCTAIDKINDLHISGPTGSIMQFSLGDI